MLIKCEYRTYIGNNKFCKIKVSEEEFERFSKARPELIMTDINGVEYKLLSTEFIVTNHIGGGKNVN